MFLRWKKDAEVDLLPELSGIKNFRKLIKEVPGGIDQAILSSLSKLGVSEKLTESYIHSLLLKLIGWSSYCAGVDWQNKLYEGDVNYVKALTAILLSYEFALISEIDYAEANSEWEKVLVSQTAAMDFDFSGLYLRNQAILQDAFDYANQRNLVEKINSNSDLRSSFKEEAPIAQMMFCIDVRSEVYRRHLESANSRIETIGFAGFFGFPINYQPINHAKGKNQCPVLIPSGPKVFETSYLEKDQEKEEKSIRNKGFINQAWSKFKSGSVSSYSFVSPLGLLFLPKLISDSFGWTRPVNDPKEGEFGSLLKGERRLDISQIPFQNRVSMAKSAIESMGLKDNFAPLVLIAGHGSTSVNNPHASAYDCGACGGNSGEVNAITAKLILNDIEVRKELINHGVEIPEETYFIACIHDTTTDDVMLIDEHEIPEIHRENLLEIKDALEIASVDSRKYRLPRFDFNRKLNQKSLIKRSNDWAEIRPEWGLAGCNSFIIAPRHRTSDIDLEGKAFLHSYDWKSDGGFKVLEAIMTAPMIVTSWINLQYYASTVDNEHLGAGNKTLHNVVGNMGVLEGARGDLRIGLPFQSIHDGEKYQHLPLRLNVVIEAPKYAVIDILEKHPNIKELLDNEWIHMMLLDDDGRVKYSYTGNNQWEKLVHENVETDNAKVIDTEYVIETI